MDIVEISWPTLSVLRRSALHALLNVESRQALSAHPRVGASWEGFALDAVVRHLGLRWEECHFWGVDTGGEIDLLAQRGRRRVGSEFKHTSSPELTRSMLCALDVLRLREIVVVHAGEHSFPLHEKVRAVPLASLARELETLG